MIDFNDTERAKQNRTMVASGSNSYGYKAGIGYGFHYLQCFGSIKDFEKKKLDDEELTLDVDSSSPFFCQKSNIM